MANDHQEQLKATFLVFTKSYERHGAKKVADVLESLDKKKISSFEKVLIDVILNKTSEVYEVSKEDIIKSNERGKIVEARKICFLLFKSHLEFSFEYIGEYFGGKDEKVPRRAFKEFSELNLNLKSDREFLEKHNQINDFVSARKQSLEKKYSDKNKR